MRGVKSFYENISTVAFTFQIFREPKKSFRFIFNFTYATCKVTFFIKNFLILPILYEGSTLINLGFLIKKDFIRRFYFRLYRLKSLYYFHSFTKF